MRGVIAVMKASLESQRMYGSRVLLGSMAASTVMFCVLSLSSAAVNSGDGFIDMSHAQVQCCFTGEPDAPMAGALPGPQVAGSAVSIYRVASTDIDSGGPRKLDGFVADQYRDRQGDDLGEVRGEKNLSSDDTKLVGAALAPDKTTTGEDTTAIEGPADPDATNGTGANRGADPASTEPASGEFTGSPEPSGPDLTSTQEEELISGGWK